MWETHICSAEANEGSRFVVTHLFQQAELTYKQQEWIHLSPNSDRLWATGCRLVRSLCLHVIRSSSIMLQHWAAETYRRRGTRLVCVNHLRLCMCVSLPSSRLCGCSCLLFYVILSSKAVFFPLLLADNDSWRLSHSRSSQDERETARWARLVSGVSPLLSFS